jgi:AcrR family transcriptional regulator
MPRSRAPAASVALPDTASALAATTVSQRERLVDAMIELCARSGYEAASIAQLSAHAGVSSETFYEQFASKEDCLLAAYRTATRRLLSRSTLSVGGGRWADELRAALIGFFDALERDPAAGRLLMIESRAAGPLLVGARNHALVEFEGRLEAFLDRQSAPEVPDLPIVALVGAVRGIAARALREHTLDDLSSSAVDLVAWIASYGVPAAQDRLACKLELSDTRPRESLPLPGGPADERLRLPRGRHRLPVAVVRRSQRLRLLYATADVTMKNGYRNTTVADLVAAGGVSREVFYEHFADRQQAFLEALEFSTQPILHACAASYFSAKDWPRRVWRALETLISLIVSNPAIAHLRLVECYAAGPVAIRRAEDNTRTFAVFLEEGFGLRAGAVERPQLWSEAITGAVFEMIHRDVRERDFGTLERRLPQLVYVAIAPFTGPAAAARFVEQMGASSSG